MKKIVFLLVLIVNLSFAQDTIAKAKTIKLKEDQGVEVETEEREISFAVIEKIPLFKSCKNVEAEDQKKCFQEALNKHVKKHFKYPKEARYLNIEGKVMVYFTINKKGEVSNIRTLGSADQILKNEAIRIFKLLPILIPGQSRGIPVNVSYGMPLNFKLK